MEAPHAEAGGVQQTVAVPGGGEGPQPLAGPSLRPPVRCVSRDVAYWSSPILYLMNGSKAKQTN